MPDSESPVVSLGIRRASVSDARAIAEINVAGWQAAYRGIIPDEFLAGLSVATREIALESRLGPDEETEAPVWLAERGARAVGYLSSGPPRDDDVPLPAAEVYAIYVRPEAWRKGVGTSLLATAVDYWRAHGATTLVLWVLEANTAGRAFYEAMGWSEDGRRQVIDFGAFPAAEVRYRLRA